MTDPWLFLLAVAALLSAPGPTNTLMALAGTTGTRRLPWSLLGAELGGYLIAILAIRLVLGAILAAYPAALVVLKLVVAVYLVWLAMRLWRWRPQSASGPVGPAQIFVTTLFNPKALVLAIGIFPPTNALLGAYFAGFAIICVTLGFIWYSGGRLIGRMAESRAAWLPRIGAVVLVGLAAILAKSAAG